MCEGLLRAEQRVLTNLLNTKQDLVVCSRLWKGARRQYVSQLSRNNNRCLSCLWRQTARTCAAVAYGAWQF